MKKFFASVLAFLLCGAAVLSAAACTKKDDPMGDDLNNETTLQILVLNRGYGLTWAEKLGEEFMKQNEGITVDVDEAIDKQTLTNMLESGQRGNPYDLIFDVSDTQTASMVDVYAGRDGGFHDLTEGVYNQKVQGEDITFGAKMSASVRNELNLGTSSEPQYYSVPWATATLGIFYNETVLQNALGDEWKVPNTSNELMKMGDLFKAEYENKYFLYPGGLDQMSRTLFLGWWAQYEGAQNYEDFWQGLYFNGTDYELNTPLIFRQKGRLKALQALETLLRADNGYANRNAAEIGQNNFKQYQTRFFTSAQNYALYPCGDWLEQESALGGDSVVKMMRLPVLSSIVGKCDSIKGENGGSADDELSALIAAIDAGSTALSGTGYNVSQPDYDTVKDARSINASMSNYHIGFVPAYSNAIPLAEKFLLFMASDAAIKIYKENVKGGFLPFEYDYASNCTLTEIEKSVNDINQSAYFVYESQKAPLIYKGGIFTYKLVGSNIETALNVPQSSNQYMTAQEIYDWFYEYYTDNGGNQWQSALSKL